MKTENWDRIESLLRSINSEIEDLNSALVEIEQCSLGSKAKDCVASLWEVAKNLEQYSDSLYCECDSSCYEEVLELLPNGRKLSVGEMLALIDHIKTWRKEYGYPEV